MRKFTLSTFAFITSILILQNVAQAGKRLDICEEAHLIFMRSEEKLARDVYLTLASMYPEQPVFYTIATESEQTHTDQILSLLDRFKIDDPEPNADEPGYIGVFESPFFDFYFTEKFNYLIEISKDQLAALKVGAFIEELDMQDINYCNDVIYEVFDIEDETPCGLTATTVRPIRNTLQNLLEGSENHLCAFISQIGPIISPTCYEAQYISQEDVWDIVEDICPEFSGFVCPPEE